MAATEEKMETIKNILRGVGFEGFSFVPKASGFSVAGSCNPDDLVFLGKLNEKTHLNTLKDGIIVCATGFSNDAAMLEEYAQTLGNAGIPSEILDIKLQPVFSRGAYLFVPH